MKRLSNSRRPSVQRSIGLDSVVGRTIRSLRSTLDELIFNGEKVSDHWFEIGPPSAMSPPPRPKSFVPRPPVIQANPDFTILQRGNSYAKLIEYLESTSEIDLRFFLGVAVQDGGYITFLFRYTPSGSVTSLKLTMASSNVFTELNEWFYPDVSIGNMEEPLSLEQLFLLPRARKNRFSQNAQRLQETTQIGELPLEFVSNNPDLHSTWEQIRYEQGAATWLVLGYPQKAESPSKVPVLIASGSGGYEAFAKDIILESVDFQPGCLYWIYARVNVEEIDGTGALANSETTTGAFNSKRSGAKFILMSFALPGAEEKLLTPSMALRLLHHRPGLSQIFQHHLYLEARSFNDLSESSVVHRLVQYTDPQKIMLTVFIGSGSGGTLRNVGSGLNTPLMMRINPHSTLLELKQRIAQAYKWGLDRVIVLRLHRKDNSDVLKILANQTNVSTEGELEQLIRDAASTVEAKQLLDNDTQLVDYGLVSGDEIYIQLVKNANSKRHSQKLSKEVRQMGDVDRRRLQIERFMELRKRQAAFRAPMFKESLRKIEEEPEPERKPVFTPNLLFSGKQKLRKKSVSEETKPTSRERRLSSRERESHVLLNELKKKALQFGARLVDDEDYIVLDKRLGDGRTARVREGLLLCKLEQIPGFKKSRKSKVVSSRSSWSKMRKKSLNPTTFMMEGGREGSAQQEEIFEYVAIKVAIKMFTAKFVNQNVFDQFHEEVEVLSGLKHQNIVQILGVHIGPTELGDAGSCSLMIMYELMPRGSLAQLRERDEWLSLPFPLKLKMALDVARGIEFIHKANVVHRDLKSDNLLVDDDLTLKIGDFGLSMHITESAIHSKVVGTAGWIAPEVLLATGYDESSDIFSLGIILWELITTEKNPLMGVVEDEYLNRLESGERPKLPDGTNKVYAQLVERCWQYEADQRPKISEVVNTLQMLLQQVLKVKKK